MATVNLKLKGIMASKDYSIQRLADEIGINYSTMQRKISGKATFDLEEAKKIRDILQMTPEETNLVFLEKAE